MTDERIDKLEVSVKMLANSLESERTARGELDKRHRDLCLRVSNNHDAALEQTRVKCNSIDLNSTRKELAVLITRVEALESDVEELRATRLVDSVASEFEEMSNEELTTESCKVLAGVLDDWEGDNSALRDYGEIRCKHLLAEMRKRGLETG